MPDISWKPPEDWVNAKHLPKYWRVAMVLDPRRKDAMTEEMIHNSVLGRATTKFSTHSENWGIPTSVFILNFFDKDLIFPDSDWGRVKTGKHLLCYVTWKLNIQLNNQSKVIQPVCHLTHTHTNSFSFTTHDGFLKHSRMLTNVTWEHSYY